ncbi:NTP transferase domain-containing protein [Aeromicrobium sp.]|uniref:molybdenum cofactor guanylyltransferase n=1 Tax=Aeromicrobium sp. TaxID=1871063 RepID=UPI0019CC554B|nr:NTP transferase domain-containing protein [Aeromicrobium sp.]MBC7631496.1 NTP transferase domain-containing protein [Aeromicrobium sp.]
MADAGRGVGTDMGEWDAVVLAGGRGSRMGGVDKASIELDGETLLARTLRAVSGAARVVVVGDVEAPGHTVVQEAPRFSGPASAIGAGVAEVHASHVLLTACDQPFLADALDLLLDACAGGTGDGAIAVDGDRRRQHLMSVVRTEALRDSIRSHPTLVDLSVRALLAPLDLVEVVVPARAALDIDTWHDQQRALAEGHDRG